jgi:hypothetical protein
MKGLYFTYYVSAYLRVARLAYTHVLRTSPPVLTREGYWTYVLMNEVEWWWG